MTDLRDDAAAAISKMSSAEEDEIARVVVQLTGMENGNRPLILSPGERAAIASSKDAAIRGEFAAGEQVRAVWAQHGLSGFATLYRRPPTSVQSRSISLRE